jgi:hypothetical protein
MALTGNDKLLQTYWRDDIDRDFVALAAPLTSTAWDGDAHSTTAATLLDLSAVFGVPAGIKAILVRIAVRDSGSAASSGLFFFLSPSNSGTATMVVRPSGLPNSYYADHTGVVPCTTTGDVYYQIGASGVNTMLVQMEIWGYWM